MFINITHNHPNSITHNQPNNIPTQSPTTSPTVEGTTASLTLTFDITTVRRRRQTTEQVFKT
jgi:hypothetical protein